MYFVNWQRNISIMELNGRKVVIKRNKSSKNFREYILISAYTLLSISTCHPAPPPRIGNRIVLNEGFQMRKKLEGIGISTPRLISISEKQLIEDFIEGGNLYEAILNGKDPYLAFNVGVITGKLHNSGYVFIDNKAQNYLVTLSNGLLRTDLAFIQRDNSLYSRSFDIGSFLASVMGLESKKYDQIENALLEGYKTQTSKSFPYLSIVLRNILCFGLSSSFTMFTNMISH
ncbi:MAG TPA: hypothetical protein VF220_03925 [Nitrososphaeraceae archaeon]